MKPAIAISLATALAIAAASAGAAVRLPDGSGANTAAEIIAHAPASDWRALDPARTLYMELPTGRVVIELDPAYAPVAVANIETLAHEHFYDGLTVERSQDNYVVQWGDRDGKKPLGSARTKVPGELWVPIPAGVPFFKLPDRDTYAPETGFSDGLPVARDPAKGQAWGVHCYGTVGVARDTDPSTGTGVELYAINGQAPRHLDRNTTVVGWVAQGMDLLSVQPRGAPAALGFYDKPDQGAVLMSVRLGTDVPEAERARLQVMRTDSPSFKAYIEARRNRSEAWFHEKANAIDVCNAPVPVRVAP
ncbi:MAG TPA: peptidylprolyl isomerase [Caulobacteraceae bacterium]|jgi:peptidylprolyl isomerase|nr:peptidylprolyl isomerase [Caulobacteraceae bacterium]